MHDLLQQHEKNFIIHLTDEIFLFFFRLFYPIIILIRDSSVCACNNVQHNSSKDQEIKKTLVLSNLFCTLGY